MQRKKNIQTPGATRAACASADAPIVVTLREGNQKAWLLAAKETTFSGNDLGIAGETKVYIRASLSPSTAYLLWKAKSELNAKSQIRLVRDGIIMVRKAEGDKNNLLCALNRRY